MKRLFIAVPVTPEPELLEAIRVLKSELASEQINWVKPENLHFTLQFLGNTYENQISEIINGIHKVSLKFKTGRGLLKGMGYFSQQGNPRVIFTKLEGLPEMATMAKEIFKITEPLGFIPDHRIFKPHLTLGRIKYLKNTPKFFKQMESFKDKSFQKFTANQIILFESILLPQGPVYKPIEKFIFQELIID
jgi:RNA 2',3'-cyclic 3'-phosphodiesterase